MTSGAVIDLVRISIVTLIQVSAPVLVVSMVVGLFVSILQTTTSIQEQTLTFVPKIIAVLLSMIYFGNFMIDKLRDFTMEVFRIIPSLGM